MKRNWMATLVIAGGLGPAMFGQQYPQQYPQQTQPYQGDPNYNGQVRNDSYSSGQYYGDPGNSTYNDPNYDSDQGYYAPAPPPIPQFAYQRPPMPGPGYYWVDGYWNFNRGRYAWVGGYWMLPPYTGAYWVAPRYSGGHFFLGFWGGGRRDVNRSFGRYDFGYQGHYQAPRPSYRAPAQNGFGSRGNNNFGSRNNANRGARPDNRGQHGNGRR